MDNEHQEQDESWRFACLDLACKMSEDDDTTESLVYAANAFYQFVKSGKTPTTQIEPQHVTAGTVQ